MPTVTVNMFAGGTNEQKDELSQVFKKELSRILKGDHGEIKVVIDDPTRPAKKEYVSGILLNRQKERKSAVIFAG